MTNHRSGGGNFMEVQIPYERQNFLCGFSSIIGLSPGTFYKKEVSKAITDVASVK
jgi:hypothetical protein